MAKKLAIHVSLGRAPNVDSKKYSENTIGIQKLNISIALINGLNFIYHNLGFIKTSFYNNKKGPKLSLLRLSLRLYIILCWLYIILSIWMLRMFSNHGFN